MEYISFNVEHQSISRTDKKIVVSKSQNYLGARFVFSDEWDDVSKTAVFTSPTGTAYAVILEDDACTVPWECLTAKGNMEVSVFGGDLITVDSDIVHIFESGYTEDVEETITPTPSVFSQIMDAIDDLDDEKADASDLSDLEDIVDLNTASRHSHTNKTVLDGITSQKVAQWDAGGSGLTPQQASDLSANTAARHTHANKTVLDGITSQKVADWDSKADEEDIPSDDHIAEIVADNIPSEDITANTDARHTHDNKTVLDGITAEKVSQWDAGGGESVITTINQDESLTVSDLVELADGLYYMANPIDGFVWFSGLIQVEDGYITVFNLGQMVGELNDDGYTFDYSVSVDGFGSTEMIGASDGQVLTYDAGEGKAVFKDPTGGGSGSSYTFSTNSVATEGDGAMLLKANDGSSTQTVSLRPPYTRINSGDCDNLIYSGWYYVVSAVVNRPITGSGAFYIMVGGNTVNLFQIAVNYANNDMYKRSHTTQGWTKWKRFANDMWRLYDTIEFTEQTNPVIYTFTTPVKEFYIQTNAYVGSNIGYMYPNSGTLYVGVHGGTANNFHMYHCYILEGKYVVCESCTGGSNATGLQRAVREMTISEFSSFKFAGDVPAGAKWHIFTKEI